MRWTGFESLLQVKQKKQFYLSVTTIASHSVFVCGCPFTFKKVNGSVSINLFSFDEAVIY